MFWRADKSYNRYPQLQQEADYQVLLASERLPQDPGKDSL